MRLQAASIVLFLALLRLLTHCTDCTAIGCFDGFSLRVVDANGQPVGSYTATVAFGTLSTRIDCFPEEEGVDGYDPSPPGIDIARPCVNGELFVELPAGLRFAELEIGAAEGQFSGSLEIAYEVFYPNGEDCGGACDVGAVQVDVR